MRSIRVGSLAGVPIGFQPLWLLIVALLTWSLGAGYYPEAVPGIARGAAYGLGLLSALLLFASILLHELGHAVVARRHGVEIEEIDLWLLGGVARMKGYPKAASDELRFAIAGPAVTAGIVAVFGFVAALLPSDGLDALRALVVYEAAVNALILVFNLLPAFPLDGGRVLRALLWRRGGELVRATETAAGVGRVLGYAMIGLGVLAVMAGGIGGLWIALIGLFVVAAARSEQAGIELRTAFGGRRAASLMSFPAVTVPAGADLVEVVEDYFVARRMSAFPVVDQGRLVGLIDAASVERVPTGLRALTTAGEACLRDPELVVDGSQDVAELLERPAFQRVGRAAVLTEEGIGVLSVTDVQRALRAQEMRRAGKPPRAHLA